LTILPEKPVRMAGEPIPSLTGVENEHSSTGADQLQRGRKAGIASADDDYVEHG
jgi:hypothetical protein